MDIGSIRLKVMKFYLPTWLHFVMLYLCIYLKFKCDVCFTPYLILAFVASTLLFWVMVDILYLAEKLKTYELENLLDIPKKTLKISSTRLDELIDWRWRCSSDLQFFLLWMVHFEIFFISDKTQENNISILLYLPLSSTVSAKLPINFSWLLFRVIWKIDSIKD